MLKASSHTHDNKESPSLRGSGLTFDLGFDFRHAMPVSLFTREWIEINIYIKTDGSYAVSLFTREWIEISPPS